MTRRSFVRCSAVCLFTPSAAAQNDAPLPGILKRVSEEVAVFRQNARNIVGQEVLRHKGRKSPPRFRPRAGQGAIEPPAVSYVTREIVSEYGYSTFTENPQALHEFRQVVAVNGRAILDREKARTTLAINMKSEDDRARRRMLQDFERHGTVGAATDFGLMLLLFDSRDLDRYEFQILRDAYLGADPVIVVSYRQKKGSDGLSVYQGRELVRVPMSGELWVRRRDGVPLRVTMLAEMKVDKRKSVHAAEVDYTPSARGVLLPASVHYTETVDGVLMTENLYRYSAFKTFSTETEVKFTPADEPPPK
jgi:hypothetical protein